MDLFAKHNTYNVKTFDLFYDTEEETPKEVKAATAADEALIDCLNACGEVDMRYMSAASGMSVEALAEELRGSAIFQDPAYFENAKRWSQTEGWIASPRYLCGNIYDKYELAVRMNERFHGRFDANVAALKKIMPAKLELEEIHVSLGASWIPEDIYKVFIKDLLRLKTAPGVHFSKELSVWKIIEPEGARASVLNNYTYGTSDLSAVKIIEQTMNARTVKVYDYKYHYDGSFERILNRPKTLEAQEKQRAVIREFEKWVLDDPVRKAKLRECYNDTYVGYAFSPYDGSFLKLPDIDPKVKLYRHQRSAVARILLSNGNVLLAHDVGTGKTYEMAVSAHELKRMGLSGKNLIVVPNNVLKAASDAHKTVYPNDKILTVYPKDFVPAKRNKILSMIRDEDYVCVYMAYSSFDMIVMSKKYREVKKKKEISDLLTAAANCADGDEKRSLESEAKRLKKSLAEFMRTEEDTPWLPFESLGITTLYVDEAHNYKNIPIESRTDNIVGMHGKGSKKCREMFEKCKNVKRIVFATGTPLTNSLADLFVLQSYLQSEELKFRGIDNFDMWINTFGERETNFEIDVDSGSLRPVTRFSSFHNLTELMSLFSTVCDFHRSGASDEELPAFDGYKNVCVKKSRSQAAYIKSLSERTEAIRTKLVGRKEDNLLKITTDGRKCALDIRLVDLSGTDIRYGYSDIIHSKISACADTVAEIYRDHPGTCQIVFCDIGTPKSTFNVYDELKNALVRRGIPEYETAFVHDAVTDGAKAKLYAAMNAGNVRVTIGSTAKLGIGVNVQEKLIAIHHLSVPWRPADMVQREGRIIRRGNTCEKVFIYRYITEGSFDSYSWQLLENKQRFISSFLSGTSGERDRADIADTVLTYSEVKALAIGNPLIKKRVETANRLERAKISARQRQKQLIELRAVVDGAPARIAELTEARARAAKDAASYAANREAVPMDERRAFGEELLEAIRDNEMRETERVFGWYQGFEIILPAEMAKEKPFVYAVCGDGGKNYVEMDGDKALGCAMRLDRFLDGLTGRVRTYENQIIDIYKQRDEAKTDLERGNPYDEQIDALTAELEKIDKKLSGKEGKAS